MKLDALMVSQLQAHPQWPGVVHISQQLLKKGYSCYIVGGSVRDLFFGKVPHDLDLVTDAKPDEVQPLFDKVLVHGLAFGVVQIVMDGQAIDVASMREEDEYFDGRHPEKIIFSTREKDALRRDFTINGLYLDPNQLEVIDDVKGIPDIKNRNLRCIGHPDKRFIEDHLRILRGLRFAATFQLNIEETTFEAMKKNRALILKVSKERITEELVKGWKQKSSRFFLLELYQKVQVAELLFPGIDFELLWKDLDEILQQESKTSKVMLEDVELPELFFLIVLHFWSLHHSLPAAFRSYHFDRKQNAFVLQWGKFLLRSPAVLASKDAEIVIELSQILTFSQANKMLRVLEKWWDPRIEKILKLWKRNLAQDQEQLRPPLVAGKELMTALDIPGGAQLGELLRKIYILQLEGQVTDSQAAISAARQLLPH